jgi:hypothetical protein
VPDRQDWVFAKAFISAEDDTAFLLAGLSGGLEVWRFGGLEVWRFGGLEVWRFGGMEVWRYGGMDDVIGQRPG